MYGIQHCTNIIYGRYISNIHKHFVKGLAIALSLFMTVSVQAAELPSAYNSDISNILYQTPVKDQKNTDLCWSFAAIAAIESSYSRHGGGDIDLSEIHAAYALSSDDSNKRGFDRSATDGGWLNSFSAYLMRGTLGGLVNESDDTFTGNVHSRYIETTEEKPVSYTVPNVYKITDQNYDFDRDADKIKRAVNNYGAVTSLMVIDGELCSDLNRPAAYRFTETGRRDPNDRHTVVIVGWDDNFSRDNFPDSCRPKGNGAWLVKNSWGVDWLSCGGFVYVSYEDAYIGRDCVAFAPPEPYNQRKKIYEHDPFGFCGTMPYCEYGMNVFTSVRSGEELTEVKVYVPTPGDNVEIFCIPDYKDGTLINFDTLRPVAEFEAADQYGEACEGYFTIPLDEPVEIGRRFAIIVKYASGNVPVECPMSGYSSQAFANKGGSFVYNRDDGMQDISRDDKNVCIKAVTM
jgi:C1A family cysteine protease